MNKILLLIATFLGMGATVNEEHLDFRPEISTSIAKIVMSNDEIPVIPPDNNNDCPCNKTTGIITQGDGHQTKCPCDNGECGCVNKPSLPEPPEPEPEPEECDDNSNSSSRKGLLKRIFRR